MFCALKFFFLSSVGQYQTVCQKPFNIQFNIQCLMFEASARNRLFLKNLFLLKLWRDKIVKFSPQINRHYPLIYRYPKWQMFTRSEIFSLLKWTNCFHSDILILAINSHSRQLSQNSRNLTILEDKNLMFFLDFKTY